MKHLTKELLSETLQIKITPTFKAKLQELADKDKRELSAFARLHLEKLVK